LLLRQRRATLFWDRGRRIRAWPLTVARLATYGIGGGQSIVNRGGFRRGYRVCDELMAVMEMTAAAKTEQADQNYGRTTETRSSARR
jgi:hypothetical protein